MSDTGVYKYTTSSTTLAGYYEGCNDNMVIVDYITIYNRAIENSFNQYFSETLNASDYTAFKNLLSIMASQLDGDSNAISECYNIENMDVETAYKISSLYNINYPLDYDGEYLKLLILNYARLRRMRGGEECIRQILKLMDKSESGLYENDADTTVITRVDDGVYDITNTRILNHDFANYLLSKFVRAGIKYTFNSAPSLADSDEDNPLHRDHSVTAITHMYTTYDSKYSLDDTGSIDDELESSPIALITDKIPAFDTTYDF